LTGSSWAVETPPSRRYPVYTRLNANDVMPDPITPLGASLVWIPHILPGWGNAYIKLDSFTPAELAGEEASPVAGFMYGYLYINQTCGRIIGIRAGIGAEAVDAAFFSTNSPAHVPSPSDVNEELSARMAQRLQWALTTTSFPELDEDREIADRERAHRPDLRTATDEALVARARSMAPLQRLMWRGEVIAGNQASVGPGVIASLLGDADPTLVVRLVGHTSDVDSALPSFALWDLSRTVREDPALTAAFDSGLNGLLQRLRTEHPDYADRFDAFVREFGYRGPSEWDIGVHSWETSPELPLALIDRLRCLADDASPSARREQPEAQAAAALAEALQMLGSNEEAVQTLHMAIASARRFAAWRERGKTNAVKLIHEVRAPLFELGRRLVERGELDQPQQVFMALESELDTLAIGGASMRETLRQREKDWAELFDIDPPTWVTSSEPLTAIEELPRKSAKDAAKVRPGDVLAGAPASAGIARGRARVIHDITQVASFEPGEILVAPRSDPSWTPLFMVASAVVVDVGAMGSHAMIVSRELGVPCAAGVTDATARIPDGTMLEVDGSSGRVTVLEG
jgi:rifampicin phosphotransferase